MRKKLVSAVAACVFGVAVAATTASATLPPPAPPPSISQTAIDQLQSGYWDGTGGCFNVLTHNINTTGAYHTSPVGVYVFQQVGMTLCPAILGP